jgi:hypothetical protein
VPVPEFFEGTMKVFFASIFILATLSLSANASKIIDVVRFINHTGTELKRNQAAIAKIEETVNGQCFKDEWLKRPLIQTNGKTNKQILNEILAVKTSLKLSMYRKRLSKVNGYRNVGSDTIHLNRKYHDYYGACSIGSNIGHERLHIMNYKHDFNPNKQRPFSVPYSFNVVYEKCCRD